MKNILHFFLKNNGGWLGVSMLISKLSFFLLVFFAARMMTTEKFGFVTSGLNFIGFFLTLLGLGNYQGMLRFGSVLQEQEDKLKLEKYSITYGMVAQILISVLMVVLAFIFFKNDINRVLLVLFLGIRVFGIYFLEHGKAFIRANFNNKKFATLEIVHAVFTLALGVILLYFYSWQGYIFAMCLSPFVVFFFHFPKFNFSKPSFPDFSLREFWKFSFTTALATQISEWIFMLDILMIGLLLHDTDVAYFRVNSLIPMNLMFISYVVLMINYPELCKRHQESNYRKSYFLQYQKLMIPIGFALVVGGFFFGEFILQFFGERYYSPFIFNVLMLAMLSVLLIRAPFTYLLAALGKPVYNLWISIFSVVLIVVSLYIVIPKFGIFGVAVMSVVNLTTSGILYAFAYFYETKRLL